MKNVGGHKHAAGGRQEAQRPVGAYQPEGQRPGWFLSWEIKFMLEPF